MFINLGYEVGSAVPISIPLKHLVITGMTQDAGKTTALDALAFQSKRRTLAFITKRGEGGFESGRLIPPYLEDRADWESVESIIEAIRKERMKFERSWIVKCCNGASSLKDVQANAARLERDAKRSMDKDLFMLLGKYLERVVPEIDRLPKSPRVALEPGVNVMDLRPYVEELHSLIISSAIRWIRQHETEVITIIPEVWKFTPQSRSTPVKVEVRSLIREGAALGNYVWFDSQDIAIVDKELLRSAGVWLLGVQRETNEIKRTLENIPEGIKKPKRSEIPTLKLGEFFACFGTHVHKTYVKPIWMDDGIAVMVANGRQSAENFKKKSKPEKNMDYKVLYEQEKQRADKLQATLDQRQTDAVSNVKVQPVATVQGKVTINDPSKKVLIPPVVMAPMPSPDHVAAEEKADLKHFDDFYEAVKSRLIQEAPGLIISLTKNVPEIELHVQRNKIKMDTSTAKGRVAFLIHEGFLSTGKRPKEVIEGLEERGFATPPPRVSEALKELVELGFLIPADGSGRYRSVEGMKVNIVKE